MFLALDFLFELTAYLQLLLGGFLIVPEIRRGRLCFDLIQLFATRWDIKETSRVGLRARGGRQTKYVIPELIR